MKRDEHSLYNILYLEDDLHDERITRFIELAKKEKISLEITNDPDSFLVKGQRLGMSNNNWDAIICDIEIWQSSNDGVNLLKGLGFNYIDYLIKKGIDSIYVIISNTPTSFFNRITSVIPRINNVKQKDKIFISEDSIRDFILELKNIIDNKRQKLIVSTPITTSLFDVFNNYIHQKGNYPLTITLKTLPTFCDCFDDIEFLINEQYEFLKSIWEKDNSDFRMRCVNMQAPNSNFKLGGEFRRNDIVFSPKQINNFIWKLILRRLVLYISGTCNVSLQEACMAVSNQQKCFDNVLLFSQISYNFSIEEKDFLNTIRSNC